MMVPELVTDVNFGAWTWNIRRTGSKTWRERANTVLILSIGVKHVDVIDRRANTVLILLLHIVTF